MTIRSKARILGAKNGNLELCFTHRKDEEKLQTYIQGAGPVMLKNGGEALVRGQYRNPMFGDSKSPRITAVFRFPDMASEERIYTCAEYHALIPLGDAAGDITIDFYEEYVDQAP